MEQKPTVKSGIEYLNENLGIKDESIDGQDIERVLYNNISIYIWKKDGTLMRFLLE